jgi:hypothetical protein
VARGVVGLPREGSRDVRAIRCVDGEVRVAWPLHMRGEPTRIDRGRFERPIDVETDPDPYFGGERSVQVASW